MCAAIGTALVLLSITGISATIDDLALIAASVAFAAAAIFLIMSVIFRRSSRRHAITYQPSSDSDPGGAS